jgi:ABC-2 type transport system ATP-binding protein
VTRFELDPSRKVGSYSRGNRQKVVVVAALMTRAPLLILDEPTTGLDPLMEQAFRLSIREAQERGQTVFLSSHTLSDVEALCTRIAILRRGELVETGTLAQMRHLSAVTVEATFEGAVPDISRVPGVSGVKMSPGRLKCQVRGPIGPLLRALSGTQVVGLLSREPSLEELFLSLYGDGDGDGV